MARRVARAERSRPAASSASRARRTSTGSHRWAFAVATTSGAWRRMCGSRSRRSSASRSSGSGGAAGTPTAMGHSLLSAVTRHAHAVDVIDVIAGGVAGRGGGAEGGPAGGALGQGAGPHRRGAVGPRWCGRGGPGSRPGRPRRTGRGPRRGRAPSRRPCWRTASPVATAAPSSPASSSCRRRRPRVNHSRAPSPRARNSASAALRAIGFRPSAPAGAGGKWLVIDLRAARCGPRVAGDLDRPGRRRARRRSCSSAPCPWTRTHTVWPSSRGGHGVLAALEGHHRRLGRHGAGHPERDGVRRSGSGCSRAAFLGEHLDRVPAG